MAPSLYSPLDMREPDDSSYCPLDEHRKEVQMKHKLVHRLIGRFEKDTSVTDDVLSRQPVESSDLASAVALASLAYQAPSRNRDDFHKHDRRDSIVHFAPRYIPAVRQMNFPCANKTPLPNKYPLSDHNPRHIDDKWICDYCHIAAFDTFQEASEHEAQCGIRRQGVAPKSSSVIASRMRLGEDISEQRSSQETEREDTESDYQDINNTCKDSERHDESHYFSGTVPLSIPTTDSEWLSELNCYVRDKCVEAFSAKVGEFTL